MIEQYYIRLNEFKPNDFNYVSMLVVENKPFSYDIGNCNGTREQVLDYVTKRTINRAEAPKISFLFRYQTLDDTKIMKKNLNNDFYSHYDIEMTPSVFASDIAQNDFIDEILKNHSLRRRMFDLNTHQY